MTRRAARFPQIDPSRSPLDSFVGFAAALLESVHQEDFQRAMLRALAARHPGCAWALVEHVGSGRHELRVRGPVSAAEAHALCARLGVAPETTAMSDTAKGSPRHGGSPVVRSWYNAAGDFAVALAVWAPKGAAGPSAAELGSVLALLGPALASARAVAALREQARVDEQTGALTRAAIRELFEKELRRAIRYGRNLSVLYIDLDNLKHVNDTFGHAAGDEFIASLVRILRDALRGSDAVGRLGGDEFLVVLPETNGSGASTVSERIRASLMTRTFTFSGVPMILSASIGYASLGEDGPEGLLEVADARMLEAKYQRARARGCARASSGDGVAA